MKITQEFVDANPNTVVVLERFDIEKNEHTGIHYVHSFPLKYLSGIVLDLPEWCVWSNKEVAQFAADQFNKLYSCVKPSQESSYIFSVGGTEQFRFYSDGSGGYSTPTNTIESNWFGAILAFIAGYSFMNDKIKKIEYVVERAMWGTNGKRR